MCISKSIDYQRARNFFKRRYPGRCAVDFEILSKVVLPFPKEDAAKNRVLDYESVTLADENGISRMKAEFLNLQVRV